MLKRKSSLLFLTALVVAVPALCQPQGVITTVAGNGTLGFSGDGGAATSARLGGEPLGVAVDNAGNVYIADGNNNRVRRVDASGIIRTVAGGGTSGLLGDGDPATSATITVQGITVDGAGNLYIAGGRIRKVNPAGIISTVAEINASSVAVDGAGNLYVSDILNHRIRKIDATGNVTTVAGNGTQGFTGDGGPATSASLFLPQGVAADAAGNIYFADNTTRVRKVDTAGIITTVAGSGSALSLGDGGPALNAGMTPTFVSIDREGNLYLADTGGSRIRKVNTNGIIRTFAGSLLFGFSGDGGPATEARLFGPTGVAVDGAGNVYIADTTNNRIRKVAGVAATTSPAISANGVVNGASFQPGIVPNSWATILGSMLASTTGTWENVIVDGNLPTTLAGVSVTIGGRPGYLYYVSPGQINLLVPDIAPGPAQVVVTNSLGTSAAFTVTLTQHGPAFFEWPGRQAVATRQDFSLAARNGTFAGAAIVPAKPGDVIILWGTGFGPTTPAAPAGVQVPSNRTYSTSTLPVVTINNIPATVFGAALAPGFAGLYQVAIQVPSSLADGDWPVQVSIGGVTSANGVVLSVRR